MTRRPSLAFSPGALGPLLAASRLRWQDLARCAETDPEAFFPEAGGSPRRARRICMGCEVRAECLEYALRNNEQFGVWGGTSEAQRRRMRTHLGLSSYCQAGLHEMTPANTSSGGSCRSCNFTNGSQHVERAA